jgi:hypothetical protein
MKEPRFSEFFHPTPKNVWEDPTDSLYLEWFLLESAQPTSEQSKAFVELTQLLTEGKASLPIGLDEARAEQIIQKLRAKMR